MHRSHAASTVAVLTAGLTTAVVLSRRAARRLPAATAPADPLRTGTPAHLLDGVQDEVQDGVQDGVVLPFLRPVPHAPEPVQSGAPARCGDSGGQTKAGTPCAVRVTAGSRCRHHQVNAPRESVA